jgi:hypothetical protein
MLFVKHSKCRDMKSKKAGNNNKNNILKRNNKTATISGRRSKTNSDRIVKKRRQLAIKKTKPLKRKQPQQQQISIKRSSGRKEKFDTDRMAQTVSRSGVPFLMARDIAKKVSNKVMSDTDTRLRHTKGRKNSNKSRSIRLKEKTVTGSKIRNLVSNELRNRNRGDIAASYSGQTPENTLLEKNLRSKQSPAADNAANRKRLLYDESRRT